MIKFCGKNEVFKNKMYGFRMKQSCAHAIASIIEFMEPEIEKQATVKTCFIDL